MSIRHKGEWQEEAEQYETCPLCAAVEWGNASCIWCVCNWLPVDAHSDLITRLIERDYKNSDAFLPPTGFCNCCGLVWAECFCACHEGECTSQWVSHG